MSVPAPTTAEPGDPYGVPLRRRPSEGTHLVNAVRAVVNAWRANSYPGASPTTRRLLGFWFDDEHRTPDGAPFRFYFCQREAVETFIYLSEIDPVRSFLDLLPYASQQILIQPGETKRPRLAFKMATGSGKTMAMSLVVLPRPPGTGFSDDALVPGDRAQYHRLRAPQGRLR
jgi:type III restriction enzyme